MVFNTDGTCFAYTQRDTAGNGFVPVIAATQSDHEVIFDIDISNPLWIGG